MGFIAGLFTFFVLLAMNAPFFWACALGVGAWAIVRGAISGRAQVRQAATADSATTEELMVDVGQPDTLRAYLRRLSARVQALESEVAALKGRKPGSEPDIPQSEKPGSDPGFRVEVPKPAPVTPPPPPVVPPVAPIPQPILERKAVPEEKRRAVPEEPSWFSNLLSGNIVAKVGALILFIGVGFLLKFAYDRNMFPPEFRLAGVALAAAVVFVIGWRLRESRRLYGLILQGVASGLAYLDVYFALKTYAFIGPVAGFGLFALLGAATAVLAVRQDAKVLALFGLTGAFMAPILASTGEGNHVVLFSYYLLLNLFVLALSWFKAWRALNLAGFFFTLIVGAAWGAQSYRPELFGTVEPFLVAFFAIYLVIPILFALRQPPELRGLVDGTLVFGTPAAAAALQAKLVWGMPYGLAWSAAAGAALYALLAPMALRHANMRLLGQTYVALAVGLGTLAIFFAFGAYTTFALWTIEGAAILWVCLRQNHLTGRLFALLVQLGGAAYFALDYFRYLRVNPWFNDAVVGCLIIAVASLISASLLRRYASRITELEKGLGVLLLLWALLWWSVLGLDVIYHGVTPDRLKPAIAILFFSATALAFELAGAKLGWPMLRGLGAPLPLVLLLAGIVQGTFGSHALADLGWLAWPLGFGSLFWTLHRQRRDGFDAALDARYSGAWLVLTGVASWQAIWHLHQAEFGWTMALGLVGFGVAALRFHLRERESGSHLVSTLALLWALFFWFLGGIGWIDRALPASQHAEAMLLLVAATALAFVLAQRPLQWPGLRMAARLPWIALPVLLLMELARSGAGHPFDSPFAIAWPLALGLALWALRREEAEGVHAFTGLRHALALYVPAVLAVWELGYWLGEWHFGAAWRSAALVAPAALAVLGITAARDSGRWPLASHWPLYRDLLLVPFSLVLVLWALAVNVLAPGSLAPLGLYLPLLNPIDVLLALATFAMVGRLQSLEDAAARGNLLKVLVVLGFVWLNGMALRSVHYWADVPYRVDALFASVLVQATLSLLWSAAALTLMVISRRRMQRGLWIAGAALLAVVVGKLFLIDLASSGTVERIVSFLGVGVVLLVIGYLAPVPPGTKESAI